MGISTLIRQLRQNLNDENYSQINRQVANLKYRTKLIISVQAVGVVSLILCTLAMISYFFEASLFGYISFGFSLVLMVISLIFSLIEITVSGKALNVELEGMEKQHAIIESKK